VSKSYSTQFRLCLFLEAPSFSASYLIIRVLLCHAEATSNRQVGRFCASCLVESLCCFAVYSNRYCISYKSACNFVNFRYHCFLMQISLYNTKRQVLQTLPRIKDIEMFYKCLNTEVGLYIIINYSTPG